LPVAPIRDRAFVRAQTGWQSLDRDEFERRHGAKYLAATCHQLWDEPQINWDSRVLGCCRNFWGDLGGNAFSDGLLDSVNSENMLYARAMLSGRKPPRDDIPCTSCELYLGMRDHGKFIVKE